MIFVITIESSINISLYGDFKTNMYMGFKKNNIESFRRMN